MHQSGGLSAARFRIFTNRRSLNAFVRKPPGFNPETISRHSPMDTLRNEWMPFALSATAYWLMLYLSIRTSVFYRFRKLKLPATGDRYEMTIKKARHWYVRSPLALLWAICASAIFFTLPTPSNSTATEWLTTLACVAVFAGAMVWKDQKVHSIVTSTAMG